MIIWIRGAGDIATGIAFRLKKSGFQVVMSDLPIPTSIRRTVCFSEAIIKGETTVEDITARLAQNADEAARNHGTRRNCDACRSGRRDCKTTGALCRCGCDSCQAQYRHEDDGRASRDRRWAGVHRGCGLPRRGGNHARAIRSDGPTPPDPRCRDTGIPGNIAGFTLERLLRAPRAGVFHAVKQIGDEVRAGDVCAYVDGEPMITGIAGVLRGILPDGITVTEGMKSGDVDPRCDRTHCFIVSDKALAIGGGVMEAVLSGLQQRGYEWKHR